MPNTCKELGTSECEAAENAKDRRFHPFCSSKVTNFKQRLSLSSNMQTLDTVAMPLVTHYITSYVISYNTHPV